MVAATSLMQRMKYFRIGMGLQSGRQLAKKISAEFLRRTLEMLVGVIMGEGPSLPSFAGAVLRVSSASNHLMVLEYAQVRQAGEAGRKGDYVFSKFSVFTSVPRYRINSLTKV